MPFCPYHFVRAILSVPFCPIPFCSVTYGSGDRDGDVRSCVSAAAVLLVVAVMASVEEEAVVIYRSVVG